MPIFKNCGVANFVNENRKFRHSIVGKFENFVDQMWYFVDSTRKMRISFIVRRKLANFIILQWKTCKSHKSTSRDFDAKIKIFRVSSFCKYCQSVSVKKKKKIANVANQAWKKAFNQTKKNCKFHRSLMEKLQISPDGFRKSHILSIENGEIMNFIN